KYSVTVFLSLGVKLAASVYYFYLTGGSIPTLRALVFILAYDTVYSSGKKPDPLTLYFFSLTGVSVLISQSASSISFMMSALCVATVLNVWNKLPGSLTVRIIVLSILINYILIPVNIVLTGCCPLFSPFVNLLVIPLVSISVPFISLAQFTVFLSRDIALSFLEIADTLLFPVVFHIEYWSEISTRLMMPLVNPSFFVKVLFTVSFFLSIVVNKPLKIFFLFTNLLMFIMFVFSFNMEPVMVFTPFSLYGNAKCVVFSNSSGEIYFDSSKNNSGATLRFYHRMEKAATECKISNVISITSKYEFHHETIKKIKQRYRFRNTVFKTYLPDRSFDRNQPDESFHLLNDPVP
ncbi:MAG TPA: hypothetical protein ENN58_03980, partial [bacterium]|nr:hypothetical protein [bacterium]